MNYTRYCKTCKEDCVLTTACYYLGTKRVWKCKCGHRLFNIKEVPHYRLSEEDRKALEEDV